jgi:hypothetical protein
VIPLGGLVHNQLLQATSLRYFDEQKLLLYTLGYERATGHVFRRIDTKAACDDLRSGFLDDKEWAMTDFPRTVRERVEDQGFLGLGGKRKVSGIIS